MLSFAHRSFPAESVTVVPQETLEEVVKKSLEPVVLSLLERPISGYDIVREIHNRYKVLIPQARIYTLLYDLEKKGYPRDEGIREVQALLPHREGQEAYQAEAGRVQVRLPAYPRWRRWGRIRGSGATGMRA